MAAIEMVQMLIEAAEYLDRRERGTVVITCFAFLFFFKLMIELELPCLNCIAGGRTCYNQFVRLISYK